MAQKSLHFYNHDTPLVLKMGMKNLEKLNKPSP
jgi:hypothetical protein